MADRLMRLAFLAFGLIVTLALLITDCIQGGGMAELRVGKTRPRPPMLVHLEAHPPQAKPIESRPEAVADLTSAINELRRDLREERASNG